MGSPHRHAVPPLLWLLSLGGALALLVAVASVAALAADPSPGPSAVESAAPTPAGSILPGEVRPPGNIQAWRDSDYITPDAPPGGMVEAGFSFWDARQQDFFEPGDVYVRLHPAKGDAAPSDGLVHSDFPGHVIGGIAVVVVVVGLVARRLLADL